MDSSCLEQFSRMRSRRVLVLRLGSRGPGGDARSLRLCSQAFAIVRNRPHSFAIVRNRSQAFARLRRGSDMPVQAPAAEPLSVFPAAVAGPPTPSPTASDERGAVTPPDMPAAALDVPVGQTPGTVTGMPHSARAASHNAVLRHLSYRLPRLQIGRCSITLRRPHQICHYEFLLTRAFMCHFCLTRRASLPSKHVNNGGNTLPLHRGGPPQSQHCFQGHSCLCTRCWQQLPIFTRRMGRLHTKSSCACTDGKPG